MGKILEKKIFTVDSTTMKVINASSLSRSKREMTKAEQCKALEYSSHATGLISDIAGDINSIPGIRETVGIFASIVSMVGHVANAGVNIASTALDCDDIPFDEIKEILDKKFNEVDKKLDKNTAALAEISQMVSKTFDSVEKTRTEMREGFNRVLDAIESSVVKSVVTDINNKVEYFGTEKERIMGLSTSRYLAQLKEEDGILAELREYATSKDNSLRMLLLKIINNNQASPNSLNDDKAYLALDALFYGIQTYAGVMFFLIQQYAYLAEHFYTDEDFEEFNKQMDKIQTVFGDFKDSLTDNNSLIDRVVAILNQVKAKNFVQVKTELYEKYKKFLNILKNLKSEINKFNLALIEDTPDAPDIAFKQPYFHISVAGWKDKEDVKYAVQFEKNSKFSKISRWSETIPIEKKTNPFLIIPNDVEKRNRLLFRKFEDEPPQLIGIITHVHTEYRDLNRDLYNAAGGIYKNTALKEVTTLLEKGSDPSAVFEKGRNAIHAASLRGNKRVVETLLSSSNPPDINMIDKKGHTPLHLAATVDNYDFVDYLLQKGANPNAKTTLDLTTPLHIATRKDYTKTIISLLKSDTINVNAKDKMGFTALHYAVTVGVSAVEILTSRSDIDINAKTNDGLTPMHLAVMNGDEELVKKLSTTNNIDLNAVDNNNMSALHHSSILGNKEIARLLISSKDIDPNVKASVNNWTPLHFALYLKKGDLALEMLQANNIDLQSKIIGDISFLHFAVANGQTNVVAELLKKGFETDKSNKDGFTSLHLAALRKEEDIAPMLVDNGANIKVEATDGSTPLHLAASAGRKTTVNFLMSKNADLKAVNKNGDAPIHEAIKYNNLDIVKYFLEKEPSLIKITNEYGQLLLEVAATYGHLNIVKYLVDEMKMKVTEPTDESRMTPLHIASLEGHADVVEYLIEKGANMYAVDGYRWPMHYALEYGNLDVVKIYAKHLDNLNFPFIFARFYTPLHLAARYNQLHVAKYLIQEQHVIVDSRDRDNETPLLVATRLKYTDIAEFLFNHGADPRKENHYNQTPISLANSYLKELFKTKRSGRALKSSLNKIATSQNATRSLSSSPNMTLSEGNTIKMKWVTDFQIQEGQTSGAPGKPFAIQNMKITENMENSEKSANFGLQNMNNNGILFLLDLILRKFTKEKYILVSDENMSELEMKASTLNVMGKYQDILNKLSDNKVSEAIDFSKMHSELHRAIMSANEDKLRKILCNYAEPILEMKNEEFENIINREFFNNQNQNLQKSSLTKQAKYLMGKLVQSVRKLC